MNEFNNGGTKCIVLAEYPEIDYTLIMRDSKYEPFVAAWCFKKDKGCWGQGHYFSDIADAVEYIQTKLSKTA